MFTHTRRVAVFAAALTAAAAAQQPIPLPALTPGVGSAGPAPTFNADQEPVPGTPFLHDLTPGYVVIEQDIQIPIAQYFALLSGAGDATFGNATYWTSQVPYDFVTSGGGAVSGGNQTAAINAMNAISAVIGVTFRPAVGSEDRIRFQNSSFNNSPVGRQGGSQIVNIFNWNVPTIMQHEIFHSLGFWHEQSRPDRDTYVTINSSSVCGTAGSGACSPTSCCQCVDNSSNCVSCMFNFNIQPGVFTYGSYDFDSMMHYGRTAFSCTGSDTITVNFPYNAQWQSVIGQRDHISYYDRITCRGIYPFSGDRWVDPFWGGTQNGGFFTPYAGLAFSTIISFVPSGGTLFVKNGATYSAIGTYNQSVTIQAPNGPLVLH